MGINIPNLAVSKIVSVSQHADNDENHFAIYLANGSEKERISLAKYGQKMAKTVEKTPLLAQKQ